MCFVAGLFVLCLYGPASTWHKRCHFACNEMDTKLSPPIDLLTQKLELSRHCSVFCVVLVWFVFWFVLVFVCFLLFLWCLALFPG